MKKGARKIVRYPIRKEEIQIGVGPPRPGTYTPPPPYNMRSQETETMNTDSPSKKAADPKSQAVELLVEIMKKQEQKSPSLKEKQRRLLERLVSKLDK